MKIHELVRSAWLTDKANQKGRGNATKGNTSGKGHKWQKARSGHKYKWSFEWWQTPLVQRMPKKKWFKRYYKLVSDITAINVSDIEANKAISSGDTITKDTLISLGIISQSNQQVKILGNWDISKSLTFDGVEHFSVSAKAKIEKAGWSINYVSEESAA